MKEIKKLIRDVEGWLSYREGAFLYNSARNCSKKGVIVEIGSSKGRSTICLGKGSQDGPNIKLYAVDPHTGDPKREFSRLRYTGKNIWTLPDFKENINKSGLDNLIFPVVKTSEEAAKNWNKPISLLFIDGLHGYEYVKKDFLLWYPHIINGGKIIFHDTTFCLIPWFRGLPGPRKIVNRYVLSSKNFKNAGIINTITYAEKCKKNSLEDRTNLKIVRLKRLFPDLISEILDIGYILVWKSIILEIMKKIKYNK